MLDTKDWEMFWVQLGFLEDVRFEVATDEFYGVGIAGPNWHVKCWACIAISVQVQVTLSSLYSWHH